MCDLIDLKSPEGKTALGPKLASPLIPAPAQPSDRDQVEFLPPSSSSSTSDFEKRRSLDNNPFDNAHRKTVEYARNQDDPFEVVLEKALTHEQGKASKPRDEFNSRRVNSDFTPKKNKYSDSLRMNRTLDDLSLHEKLKNKLGNVQILVNESPVSSSKVRCDFYLERSANEKVRNNGASILETSNLNCSILNESTMNDSLTESSGSVDDNLLRSVIGMRLSESIRSRCRDPRFLAVPDGIPKLQKHRRSLSQGDKTSPRKCRTERCRSIVDTAKGEESKDSSSVFSVPSIIFDDNMNKGFLQTFSSRNGSVQSSLSSISLISKTASVSSAFNSSSGGSSALSQRTVNRAFIESDDSVTSANGKDAIYDKIHRVNKSFDNAMGYANKGSNGENTEEKELDNLIRKYVKIRSESLESSMYKVLPSTTSRDRVKDPETEVKLIDVDIFVPEKNDNSAKKSSVSSVSSDSVFLEEDPVEKSIFIEAKTLAKTFEELASKTGSSVSSDDLVNSRPNWNVNLLPLSDDEALVDDLIVLPKSPEQSGTLESNRSDMSKTSASNSDKISERSTLDDFDSKLKDPEKKIMASTLLLDLEKLVKSEANSEAAELLKRLQRALGVKCDSNVDLLATCFSERNDLTKSPKRSGNASVVENIRHESNEKSRDDNETDTSKSPDRLSLSADKSLQHDLNIDKNTNMSKSPILVNENNQVSIPQNDQSPKISPDEINDSIEVIKRQNQMSSDQKMAVEILVGLGKLLTGDNKDPTTSTLLKNLGIALNLAARSHNSESDADLLVTREEKRRMGTPVKNRIATPPRRTTPVSHSRTVNRRSLELNAKAKTSSEHTMRRSFSVSQTSTMSQNYTETPRSPLSVNKGKVHVKEERKRFSSDSPQNVTAMEDRRSIKGIALKPVVSELTRPEKSMSTMIAGSVKNRFRKNNETDATSKRGPMKAIIPLGNMQRRGSVKKESPANGSVTPPKAKRESSSAVTVATSTPFPSVQLSIPLKKTPKSKPIASSTPDDLGSKHVRRSSSQIPKSPVQNTFSCNISPVTSKSSQKKSGTSEYSSPRSKVGKPNTPKSRQSSQLPRLSPMLGAKSASLKSPGRQRRSEPVQSFAHGTSGTLKSPGRKFSSDGPTSPLSNSNNLGVKPLNLISKLGRRKTSVAEKENYA